MKTRLTKLKELVDEVSVPVPDKYKVIMMYQNLYTCFGTAIDEGPMDLEKYNKHLSRSLLYYLSMPIVSYKNRIVFIYGFFDSYMALNHESILDSVTDTSAIMYDSSLESFIGRALAIGETNKKGNCKEIFDSLEKSLQNAKNVV